TPDGGSPRGGLTALADRPPELPGLAPVPADAAPGGEPAAAPADAGQVAPPDAQASVAPAEIPVRGDLAALEAPQAIVLEGLALDSTWIQIQWDGRGTSEEIVPQGQRRRWVARDSLLIRSGRARGIRFYYQGELLGDGRLGDPTMVLRFRADRNGVVLLGPDLAPLSRVAGGPDTTAEGDTTGP
ncbi:MAG: RodZ domain-containing protein, partial [Gemmatimonadota bacterium]